MEVGSVVVVAAARREVCPEPVPQREARVAARITELVGTAVRDARAMREQQPIGDGRVWVRGTPHRKGEPPVYIVVELALALLPKLHDSVATTVLEMEPMFCTERFASISTRFAM